MTSNRLITILRELTENQYTDSVLMMWLSNCENTVLTDVLLASPEDCVELTAPSDEKLTVPHPWDKLYLPYMQAQVAHANGEYDHYANYIALYNAYLEEYERHILETVQPAGGEAVTHGYYLSAYAIAVEHGYTGTIEQWLESLVGPQGDGGKDAYTIAVEHGYTGTVEQWLKSLIGPQGPQGKTGETTLPIARGTSGDGIAFTATGDDLPTVSVADNLSQISAVGKGRQIVFVPEEKNLSTQPTLQINGGEIIQIRMRAPRNQGSNDQSPDATLPVPTGALMRGVPYTLTFCGKYWLVDSQITQFDQYNEDILNRYANRLIGLVKSDTIGVPIINSTDGLDGNIATMFVKRSAEENANPDKHGYVTVPTEARVAEMLRQDITAAYAAWSPESGTVKTVENYAKTLPDGKYYIINGGTVYMDIFTVYGDVKYRFIRRYDDDSCYMELFRGDQLTICVEDDASSVMLYGRKMLTDWNIPLPTAADVGKVLMASAVNCAAWTEVTNAEEVAV